MYHRLAKGSRSISRLSEERLEKMSCCTRETSRLPSEVSEHQPRENDSTKMPAQAFGA